MTHFLLLFWRQIAGAICSEFVHIQSFAAYRLRLRSLPLTLRYMDKFSQLLPQLTFIKEERGRRPLFPHRSTIVGSPWRVLRTLSGRFQRPLRLSPSL
jgi:hypothetical protein